MSHLDMLYFLLIITSAPAIAADAEDLLHLEEAVTATTITHVTASERYALLALEHFRRY